MENDLRYQHSFMLAQLGFIFMITFLIVVNKL